MHRPIGEELKSFNDLFKEVYYVGCTDPKDSVKYWLIQKYWNQISMRLKAESEKIYSDGKERFSELLSQEVNRPNRFLQAIPLDKSVGRLYHTPVPLTYKHGVITKKGVK